MSKKKKNEKILEQSYTIEALEDEIGNLDEIIASTKAKLWEVICENDRLTLTYEPYRPPGDEYEGLGFYELVEENDSLTQNILDKMGVIREQDEEILRLNGVIDFLSVDVSKVAEKANTPRVKNERWWNFSIELWPGAWGLSYYRYNWQKYKGVAREGSIQVGPFGFSWNREPKR